MMQGQQPHNQIKGVLIGNLGKITDIIQGKIIFYDKDGSGVVVESYNPMTDETTLFWISRNMVADWRFQQQRHDFVRFDPEIFASPIQSMPEYMT